MTNETADAIERRDQVADCGDLATTLALDDQLEDLGVHADDRRTCYTHHPLTGEQLPTAARNEVTTVADLIAALERYDPTTPVRIATQPDYPMENTIAQVVHTPDDAEIPIGTVRADPPVVWLGAGEQVGYLPGLATNALGW